MPNSCFIFISGLVGCWWGFVCCPVHGQVSLHMPKFQCWSAILITSVARWFERLVWSTSWAQSVADGSGGWGLEPMYTANIHFHPLHFYNPPKNLSLYLEATIGKRVGPQELWVTMSKGWLEGGAVLRARGIPISLRYENMGVCLSFAHLSYRFLFVSQTRSLGRAR